MYFVSKDKAQAFWTSKFKFFPGTMPPDPSPKPPPTALGCSLCHGSAAAPCQKNPAYGAALVATLKFLRSCCRYMKYIPHFTKSQAPCAEKSNMADHFERIFLFWGDF
jgi:hypothetical protein